MRISDLQRIQPWTVPYSAEFEDSNARRPGHRNLAHDVMHVLKSLGKIAAMVERGDHSGVNGADTAGALAKETADLVICALHIANANPYGRFDLEAVVIESIEKRNGVKLASREGAGEKEPVKRCDECDPSFSCFDGSDECRKYEKRPCCGLRLARCECPAPVVRCGAEPSPSCDCGCNEIAEELDRENPPAPITPPSPGLWRCSACGTAKDDTLADTSWRWTGLAWEHKCGRDPQEGYYEARFFGAPTPPPETARVLADAVEVLPAECDIHQDRTWSQQWCCALHGVWFRRDSEPEFCPVVESTVDVRAALAAFDREATEPGRQG